MGTDPAKIVAELSSRGGPKAAPSSPRSRAPSESHEKNLEARLPRAFRADGALVREELLDPPLRQREIGPHEDLADEAPTGSHERARHLERPREELEALRLIGFARAGRAGRHVRKDDIVRR